MQLTFEQYAACKCFLTENEYIANFKLTEFDRKEMLIFFNVCLSFEDFIQYMSQANHRLANQRMLKLKALKHISAGKLFEFLETQLNCMQGLTVCEPTV